MTVVNTVMEMDVNTRDRFELIMTPEAWHQIADVQAHLNAIRQRAGQKRNASKSEAIRWCLIMWSYQLNKVIDPESLRNPEDLRDD